LQNHLQRLSNFFTTSGNYYVTDITQWLNANFQDNHCNLEIYPYLIAAASTKLGYVNKTFDNNIKNVCGEIAKQLLFELQEILLAAPSESFISSISFLHYHMILTFESFLWFCENYAKKIKLQHDNPFVTPILQTLEQFSNQIEDDRVFKGLFKKFEGYIAIEKITLQLLLEITHDISIRAPYNNTSQTNLDLPLCLEYARALSHILRIREEVSNRLACKKELTFDCDGYITYEQDEQLGTYDFGEKFLDWIVQKDNICSHNLYHKNFNPICQKYIGFSIEELLDLSDKIHFEYVHADVLLLTASELPQKVQELTGKGLEEITKLISYLRRNPIENNDYIGVISDRPHRPLRKSILFYHHGERMITSTLLFKNSLLGLISDIFYNRVDNNELQGELTNITKAIDKQFEIEVLEQIKNNLTQNICHGEDKLWDKAPYIMFPGEVDIIAFFEDTLFVIECKNFSLKHTSQSIANEINGFRKKSRKLAENLSFIHKNTYAILSKLGVKNISYDSNKKPIGLFVTKNFSLGQIIDDINFPIINACDLIVWMKKAKDSAM